LPDGIRPRGAGQPNFAAAAVVDITVGRSRLRATVGMLGGGP
jgi:hypothetical protein